MSLIPPVGISGESQYEIENSLRIRHSATAYLSRTPASAGDQSTWTFSCWWKFGRLGLTFPRLLSTGTNTSNRSELLFVTSTNQIRYYSNIGGTVSGIVDTAAVFRDPSAWYHIVVKFDTTESVAADRLKIYVNGVNQTLTTTTAVASGNHYINNARLTTIGKYFGSTTNYIDGYLTEVNFIDGQALDATNFGEYNQETGVWKPKQYTGSYGDNGFYLENGRGTDQSGNGNNWTENNFNTSTSSATTYDVMTDVPALVDEDTANFCTLNGIKYVDNSPTYTNGSLSYSTGSSWSTTTYIEGTIGALGGNTGKYYWEASATYNGQYWTAGVAIQNNTIGSSNIGTTGSVMIYNTDKYVNGTATGSYMTSLSPNEVLGIAFDASNGKVWFRDSGGWLGSGDPAAGTNETGIISGFSGKVLMPVFQSNLNATVTVNFGQRPFAYTPPTDFLKLNTYNLPDSTIVDGSDHFNTVLYTGDGSTSHAITGVGFEPDIVWIKSRSQTVNHGIHDSLRLTSGGAPKILYPSATSNESAGGRWINSFDSDGFTVNNNTAGNNNGSTYVSWSWKGGSSTVTNTSGSISANVSVNTTAGISVVTYSGSRTSDPGETGSPSTIYHGLGKTPEMVITKNRNSQTYPNWNVWHTGYQPDTTHENHQLWLHLTSGANSAGWQRTDQGFTTNLFCPARYAYDDVSGVSYIAYVFAGIEGFSKFGGYTGNGSSNGPFIYTGFRPSFILLKAASRTGHWTIFDSARDPYNLVDHQIEPNYALAESTNSVKGGDFLSNGWKVRSTETEVNQSGASYVYAAFAENPFKNALAR